VLITPNSCIVICSCLAADLRSLAGADAHKFPYVIVAELGVTLRVVSDLDYPYG
jgi:hypothetical protein